MIYRSMTWANWHEQPEMINFVESYAAKALKMQAKGRKYASNASGCFMRKRATIKTDRSMVFNKNVEESTIFGMETDRIVQIRDLWSVLTKIEK